MLYMVECDISDPHVEAEWNAYYTERKLDEVLAVPGFRTSQRFKALEPFPSPYLAIHTVDSLDVLTGNAYRSGGGGFFDPRFQPYIVNWHRNLFSGLERAPAVADDELLAVADEAREALDRAGVGLAWLSQRRARSICGISRYRTRDTRRRRTPGQGLQRHREALSAAYRATFGTRGEGLTAHCVLKSATRGFAADKDSVWKPSHRRWRGT